MIFARSNEVPKVISGVLEDMNNFSFGLKVPQIIKDLSERLHGVLATGSREAPFAVNDDSDEEMDDVSGEEEEDEAGWESEDGEFSFNPGPSTSTTSRNPELAKKLDRRIRADLRNAKFAGFSVGILQGMKADSLNSLVSLSIRVAKLGLSEEAIHAWDLEPNNYIVLLIRYSSYYKTFDAVITEPAKSLDITFRIGVSNKYKPTIVEAIAAFTDVTKDHGRAIREGSDEAAGEQKSNAGFSSMFISSSLNEFINDKFISLLKIRSSVGIGWDGAKLYFNDKQGRLDQQSAELPSVYYEESSQKESTLPDPISADHLTDHQVMQISFPLIAAQFALRYLTRCTEFCLVCHDKIEEDFEALKPYVCSKPLCLYQYMALGFGPSVEHEILTQPYVVDLLVSFCYASALVSQASYLQVLKYTNHSRIKNFENILLA
jgi:ubiquitin-conjugating enzyme E2 Q